MRDELPRLRRLTVRCSLPSARLLLPAMPPEARHPYLDLLIQTLTRTFAFDEGSGSGRRHRATAAVFALLAWRGLIVVPGLPDTEKQRVTSVPGLLGGRLLLGALARRGMVVIPDPSARSVLSLGPPGRDRGKRWRSLDRRLARVEREFGLDWPEHAETMAGVRRLRNVERCVTAAVQSGVPGDLVEAGVWRGGAAILMRGVLAALGDDERRVWLADTFAGLPKPRPDLYPSDDGVDYTSHSQLSVSAEQVRANFARYGLLDDRVRLLPGLFSETLARAPIEAIAVMRLDGDLYESTTDALSALYPRLSPGGYCIIDDYGALPACRRAVEDYRQTHDISEPMQSVGDWTGVYWRREPSGAQLG